MDRRIYKVGWKNILNINRILTTLVVSDIFLFASFGLISPIFAVFVNQQILGGTLIVVGIGEAIYLATKSILQLPIGILIDNVSGEKIDFYLTISGNLLISISIGLYIFATIPVHIYLIQALMGIGGAISYPAWMGLFTRNMEEGRESFIWSVHSTFTELFSAVAAALGGYLAVTLGFHYLFLVVSILSLIGTLLLVFIYPKILKS
ncbi:MAG: MFS transporter [Candidatus Microgenomates bacterium]|jgi:MFS family permease